MSIHRVARAALAAVACGAALAGCRSAVSTHVTPNPIEGGWDTKKVRGIPVTVKVPTGFEIKVMERRFYQPDFTEVEGAVSRFVVTRVIDKDQVFMVDSVRPGAGTLNQAAGFNNTENKQFFSTYDTKIEDKTINTIAAIIPNLPDVLSNLKKARAVADTKEVTTPADGSLAMVYTDHLVAVKLFDVNAPDLTDCVRQFMADYVNCTPPCKPVDLKHEACEKRFPGQ
jgi:hypothetical protein